MRTTIREENLSSFPLTLIEILIFFPDKMTLIVATVKRFDLFRNRSWARTLFMVDIVH